jgi:integrase/recombinase XerD
MTESTATAFGAVKNDFLGFLKFTKGYSDTTCYGYASDLKRWHDWLVLANLTWMTAKLGCRNKHSIKA